MVFVKTCVISLLLFFYIMVILCFQTDVEEARPRWGKNSKLVLVSLLLTGLLLAALLVAGYYFKTHRKNSKGVRLVSQLEEVGLVVLCQNDSECVVLNCMFFSKRSVLNLPNGSLVCPQIFADMNLHKTNPKIIKLIFVSVLMYDPFFS